MKKKENTKQKAKDIDASQLINTNIKTPIIRDYLSGMYIKTEDVYAFPLYRWLIEWNDKQIYKCKTCPERYFTLYVLKKLCDKYTAHNIYTITDRYLQKHLYMLCKKYLKITIPLFEKKYFKDWNTLVKQQIIKDNINNNNEYYVGANRMITHLETQNIIRNALLHISFDEWNKYSNLFPILPIAKYKRVYHLEHNNNYGWLYLLPISPDGNIKRNIDNVQYIWQNMWEGKSISKQNFVDIFYPFTFYEFWDNKNYLTDEYRNITYDLVKFLVGNIHYVSPIKEYQTYHFIRQHDTITKSFCKDFYDPTVCFQYSIQGFRNAETKEVLIKIRKKFTSHTYKYYHTAQKTFPKSVEKEWSIFLNKHKITLSQFLQSYHGSQAWYMYMYQKDTEFPQYDLCFGTEYKQTFYPIYCIHGVIANFAYENTMFQILMLMHKLQQMHLIPPMAIHSLYELFLRIVPNNSNVFYDMLRNVKNAYPISLEKKKTKLRDMIIKDSVKTYSRRIEL